MVPGQKRQGRKHGIGKHWGRFDPRRNRRVNPKAPATLQKLKLLGSHGGKSYGPEYLDRKKRLKLEEAVRREREEEARDSVNGFLLDRQLLEFLQSEEYGPRGACHGHSLRSH